jgi:hypothetical protein
LALLRGFGLASCSAGKLPLILRDSEFFISPPPPSSKSPPPGSLIEANLNNQKKLTVFTQEVHYMTDKGIVFLDVTPRSLILSTRLHGIIFQETVIFKKYTTGINFNFTFNGIRIRHNTVSHYVNPAS